MNTRTVRGLALMATVAVSAMLAGCNAAGNDSQTPVASPVSEAEIEKALNTPTQLTVWSWVPGLQNEIDLFEKKYPKVKVTLENPASGAELYQKVRTAIQAGQGAPDVLQMDYQYMPTFEFSNYLTDLTPYGAAALKSQFVPFAWQQVANQAGIFGFPQDSGPMINLYRQDVLNQAGVTDAPATWEDFAAAAKRVKSATGAYMTNLSGTQQSAVTGLLWQAGVKPFNYDPASKTVGIDLDTPAAEKVMTYWQNLLQSGVVSSEPDFVDPWYRALSTGTIASWQSGAWAPVFLQGTAKDSSGKWRAAALPAWTAGDKTAGNWGGSADSVLSTSKNKLAAYGLVKFLNTDPQVTAMYVSKQFLFPATVANLDSSDFLSQTSEFYGGQKVNALLASIAPNVPASFNWPPFMDYVNSSFNTTLGDAITKKGNLVTGLQAWQKALRDYAAQQGFTVK